MSAIMTMFQLFQQLLEESEASSVDTVQDRVGSSVWVDKIADALFGIPTGPVVDKKRSPDPIFNGVDNKRSRLSTPNGKPLWLTFDNSTDSGEYEINSLVPLRVERGTEVDLKIHRLYKALKVRSKKRVEYVDLDGKTYLRELYLGENPNEASLKLVKAFMKLIVQTDDIKDNE